ncbi:helix-turn-helix domain-containing protein [Bacillus paramycoides]
MLINKAYKFRIYPNQEQKALIARLIGLVVLYLIVSLLYEIIFIKRQGKD